MYVVRVVQGVQTSTLQPGTRAHGQAVGQRASYSKEHSTIHSDTATWLDSLMHQGSHSSIAIRHSLTAYELTAAGPPAPAAKPHINAPAHRKTPAGMLSHIWKPLRSPRALTGHPCNSSSSYASPVLRSSSSRSRVAIYANLRSSGSSSRSTVIHLPAYHPASPSSPSSSNLGSAVARSALPVPPPAAVHATAWALQHQHAPASSLLAASNLDRSLQRTTAASDVQGYLMSSSSSTKVLSRRPRRAVLLPARVSSSSSGLVTRMRHSIKDLAVRAAAMPPAAAANGGDGPHVWYMPALGGTLYINPELSGGSSSSSSGAGLAPRKYSIKDLTVAAAAAGAAARLYYAPGLGGSLYLNPELALPRTDNGSSHSSSSSSSSSGHRAKAQRYTISGLAAGVAAAAAAAPQFVPALGGTLYLNPELSGGSSSSSSGRAATAHDVYCSSKGATSSISSSSSNSQRGWSLAGIQRLLSRRGTAAGGGSSSSSGSPGWGAAAGESGIFGLPTAPIKLARMGVALMGLAAAAALGAVVMTQPKQQRAPAAAAVAAHAADATQSAAAAALAMHDNARRSPAGSSSSRAATVESEEGPGYYEWMEQRLQATLQQFAAEKDMLRAEMAMLQSLSKKAGSSSSSRVAPGTTAAVDISDSTHNSRWGGAWARVEGWVGKTGSSSSGRESQAAAATAESDAVGSAPAAAAAATELTAAAIASRMAEITDQLESLAVLQAALAAELLDHQQQQQRQEVQQMS